MVGNSGGMKVDFQTPPATQTGEDCLNACSREDLPFFSKKRFFRSRTQPV